MRGLRVDPYHVVGHINGDLFALATRIRNQLRREGGSLMVLSDGLGNIMAPRVGIPSAARLQLESSSHIVGVYTATALVSDIESDLREQLWELICPKECM